MIRQNWLVSYGTNAGIARALDGLASRIKRDNTLAGGVEELEANYHGLEKHFFAFFPELVRHVHQAGRETAASDVVQDK